MTYLKNMEDKILEVAKQAALEAGKIIKKYYLTELDLQNKGHFTNFATKADVESEQKIIEILTKNFPSHNIIAEESGMVNKNSQYSWAIDPIDGTIPFVDGIPVFGVSIGILKDNKPFAGVINMVATDELYWAMKGKGAFLNGKKIKVREESNLQNCTIALDLGHTDRIFKLDKFFRPIAEKVRHIYMLGSAVSALCYVAKGFLDAYIIRANIWDFAAGVVLVEEAGGKVTGLLGGEVDYQEAKPQLICSNGVVHEEILKVYKE